MIPTPARACRFRPTGLHAPSLRFPAATTSTGSCPRSPVRSSAKREPPAFDRERRCSPQSAAAVAEHGSCWHSRPPTPGGEVIGGGAPSPRRGRGSSRSVTSLLPAARGRGVATTIARLPPACLLPRHRARRRLREERRQRASERVLEKAGFTREGLDAIHAQAGRPTWLTRRCSHDAANDA